MHSIVIQKLLSTNAHLGRRIAAHHFKVYLCGSRNRIAIMESDRTLLCLRNACDFLRALVRQKGSSFFVNGNEFLNDIMEEMARNIGCVDDFQWKIGGFLTNKKSMKSLARKKKHNSVPDQRPDCLVLLEAERTSVILEADRAQIPIASSVDSKTPLGIYKKIRYPIPANAPIKFVYLFRNSITKVLLLARENNRFEQGGAPLGGGPADSMHLSRRLE